MSRRAGFAVWLVGLVALGCEVETATVPAEDAGPGVDGGRRLDAALDAAAQRDASPDAVSARDAAQAMDAAPDAAQAMDAAPDAAQAMDAAPDAAHAMDAAPDAAPPVDAEPDAVADAGPVCPPGATQPCGDCAGSVQTCGADGWGPCVVPAEVCDGADNDCDGQTDEGLPQAPFFADPDGDGFHGPTVAEVQPSCAAWLAAGHADDGVYQVDPDGDGPQPTLAVYCDMTTDGGGWTRVFFHDVAGGYWAELDATAQAEDDPLALRYSILGRLEAFRSSDDAFELRITWPDSAVAGRNVWRQRSNPVTDAVAGYEAVAVDYTDNGWGGLERNTFNASAFIDGTVGAPNWYYAVASTAPWGNPQGIPAHRVSSPRVAVWVRPDDPVARVPAAQVMACGFVPGVAAQGGDCAPEEPAAWPGAAEVCDGLDNNCNGQVDEGFEYAVWYPDRDGDGRGASAGSSCASLFAAGVVEDGVYPVQPQGPLGPTLPVFCDMQADGGGWTRVFHHQVEGGYFGSNEDAALRSAGDPLAPLYSILAHLPAFRGSDGRFELRLEWPGLPGRNIWRQTSDPSTAPVQGYQAIQADHTEQYWGGLELSDRANTYLDGSVGHPNWFYAVGAQTPWRAGDGPEGVPAYGPAAAEVALWVRPDDDRAGGDAVYACEGPPGFVQAPGDCDDTDPAVGAGAAERCNGRDDDCDGAVDEGCPPGGVALREAPTPLHFYPRDRDTGRCRVTFAGALEGAAAQVRVQALRDGELLASEVSGAVDFTVNVPVDAGLHRYDFAVAWTDADGEFWRPAGEATDVVCGDVFLIDGQSNAVATDYHGEDLGNAARNPFVRSFGSGVRDASVREDTAFSVAVAYPANSHGSVGQWGLHLANLLVQAHGVPILLINGAVGGTRVDQHQRNDADPEDASTIYGRLLWRVRRAGVADQVRGILWHQGESDGGLAYDTYLARWTAMYDDWLADYPGVEGVFVFQVRAGCGNPTWNRNVARDLPALLPRVLGSMSTTGVDGHDNCHFFHAVYVEWGERMARLVRRALYGAEIAGNIDAPSPVSARWRAPNEVAIEFGATGGGLLLQPGAAAYFSLADGAQVLDARVEGTAVVLTTAAASQAAWVTFADVPGDIPWLVNDLGIGAFAFYALPIAPRAP